MSGKKPNPTLAQDGWPPATRGWVPGKSAVQGGYIPTTSQGASSPPTGGSGVKPPKK